MEPVAADQDVPVGVHLQEVPVHAVHHHAAERREERHGQLVIGRIGVGALRRPTAWGSWGRRCSAAAREGTPRTPAGLGSARSPDSRSRETCTLQENRDLVRRDPAAEPDLQGSLRTRHGVVHVEAVAFDVFQGHAPVHKHTEREEKRPEITAPHPAAEVELGGGQRCYHRALHRWTGSRLLAAPRPSSVLFAAFFTAAQTGGIKASRAAELTFQDKSQ